MAEYIEREKLKEALCPYSDTNYAQDMDTILRIVDEFPAADVAPVVHGRPVKKLRHRGGIVCRKGLDNIGEIHTITCDERYTEESLYCPVCGKLMSGEFLHYCDNCGAKMDLE